MSMWEVWFGGGNKAQRDLVGVVRGDVAGACELFYEVQEEGDLKKSGWEMA